MEENGRSSEHEQSVYRRSAKKKAGKAWLRLRPVAVFFLALGLCAAFLAGGYHFVVTRFFSPVDSNDARPLSVTIKSGAGASSIARTLYEAGGTDEDGNRLPGLITSKTVFKIYVDFTGKSSKLKAGTYILSRNMDVSQIVDVICAGKAPRATLKLVVTEGMAVEQIAGKLVLLGVLSDTDEFLALCKTADAFADYAFLDALEDTGGADGARIYALEGYLFPDTYEIYSDESAKSIINRMLYRFSEVVTDELVARAKQMDMSLDEMITLASIIEREARVENDFTKVSAVFHQRLALDMRLQSDATLKYIFRDWEKITFTEEQRRDPSPYNSYAQYGLPPGPICNPGLRAIRAVLEPDEETVEGGYLYFCLTDDEEGSLVFAKTLEEHQANVEKYRPFW